MKKQKVVRTYPRTHTRTTERLTELLEDGWLVVNITPLEQSITEYIVEKDIGGEDRVSKIGKALLWANESNNIKAHCGYDACGEDYVRIQQLLEDYDRNATE